MLSPRSCSTRCCCSILAEEESHCYKLERFNVTCTGAAARDIMAGPCSSAMSSAGSVVRLARQRTLSSGPERAQVAFSCRHCSRGRLPFHLALPFLLCSTHLIRYEALFGQLDCRRAPGSSSGLARHPARAVSRPRPSDKSTALRMANAELVAVVRSGQYWPAYSAQVQNVSQFPWSHSSKNGLAYYFGESPEHDRGRGLVLTRAASSAVTETNADGFSLPEGQSVDDLKAFALQAKQHGVRPVFSIGGWSGSRYYSDLVATAASRSKFAKQIAAFMDKHGYVGVDLGARSFVAEGSPDG